VCIHLLHCYWFYGYQLTRDNVVLLKISHQSDPYRRRCHPRTRCYRIRSPAHIPSGGVKRCTINAPNAIGTILAYSVTGRYGSHNGRISHNRFLQAVNKTGKFEDDGGARNAISESKLSRRTIAAKSPGQTRALAASHDVTVRAAMVGIFSSLDVPIVINRTRDKRAGRFGSMYIASLATKHA
jgi:hypothetical protein